MRPARSSYQTRPTCRRPVGNFTARALAISVACSGPGSLNRFSASLSGVSPADRGRWSRSLRSRVSQSRGDRPRSPQSSIFEVHGGPVSLRALIRSADVAMALSLCRQDGGRKPFPRRERPKRPLWSGRPRRLKPAPACGLSPASDRLGRDRAARSIG
jgi:hypothetical protein